MGENLREQYEKALRLGKMAFIERPYFGSPGAPAQAETNASQIWGHLNAGYLIGYEYTRWWKESLALRQSAALGDWSWLNKTRVTGPDAFRLLDFATVKDLSRQQPGQIIYTPMCDEHGKVAIEGLTLKLAENDFIFTQSAGLKWLEFLRDKRGMKVTLEDVTPDYSCFALQGPRSTEILETLTGSAWKDLRFSRFKTIEFEKTETIVARQGVTGEIGYEFMMRTDTGRAHELWRRLREVGRDFGLRELGFKAQMIGHTETGIATVIRDYLPARGSPEQLHRMLRHWMSAEELDAAPWDIDDHLCAPAELGWGYTVNLQKADFHGKASLASATPGRRLMGLRWNSNDMAELYAAQFRDSPAAPPPDLPYGQFRVFFMKINHNNDFCGWASGYAYSPTLRRMISLARLDRSIAAGAEVEVDWGGFSDEPSTRIRAEVVELPFLKREREAVLK
ncbi:MAG TPA: aminomethyltransferase family protein [Burkholderiales bacterium]